MVSRRKSSAIKLVWLWYGMDMEKSIIDCKVENFKLLTYEFKTSPNQINH